MTINTEPADGNIADGPLDQWKQSYAEKIAASGRRTHTCRICKTTRIPVLVHACYLCD
jgi:hypothetical protein